MNEWRRWIAEGAGLARAGPLAAPGPGPAHASPPAPAQTAVQQAQAPTPSPAQPAPGQTPGTAAPTAPTEPPGPNTGAISLTGGTDWASAYYFRGIATTQNGGNNVQPYAEIGFRLLENMGPLTSLSVAPGIWTNLHTGGGLLVPPSDPKGWTETDFYFKVSATWWEGLTPSAPFTFFLCPNNTFTTYSDIGLGFSLNDSKWLGAFALNPSILFAFETPGEGLVADRKKGIYVQIGLAPGYT